MTTATTGLVVDDVAVEYRPHGGSGRLRAVAGVSLTVAGGEVVGLVGESGCGKSSLGRAVLGLEPLATGRVTLDGRPVGRLGFGARSKADRALQMIFQNPYASLNPRRRVGDQIGDGVPRPDDRRRVVARLLSDVGLAPGVAARFPHEFSGGQRQRIAIARALAADPKIIVADEPVSALDASTRAQVASLITDLARERGVGVLMITHDLAGLRSVADRVEVMYLGRIVESGPTERIWRSPAHPYTAALLAAIPRMGIDAPRPAAPSGEVPDPAAPPTGCRFHPRCPLRLDRCSHEDPETVAVAPGHRAACWLQVSGGPAVDVSEAAAATTTASSTDVG